MTAVVVFQADGRSPVQQRVVLDPICYDELPPHAVYLDAYLIDQTEVANAQYAVCVADWHDETYYSSSPPSNPPGPASGIYRVLWGGSWNHIPFGVRAAYRLQLTTRHDLIVLAATKRGVRSGISHALGGLPCEAGNTAIAGDCK